VKLKQTIHGTPLVRTLYIKVFNEENKRYGLTIVRAAHGRGYLDHDIDELLDKAADQLEKIRPHEEFALVQVGPGKFNFVWRGWKAVGPAQAVSSDEIRRRALERIAAEEMPTGGVFPAPATPYLVGEGCRDAAELFPKEVLEKLRGKMDIEKVRLAATKVVDRVFAVYNAEYIAKCLRDEPDSLLALVKNLQDAVRE
jgi:hypothetical protein